MTDTAITHAELVQRVVRWLREEWDPLIVLDEHQLPPWLREHKEQDREERQQRESPDAFAILRDGRSVVVEVKVSHDDYRRDHRKDHRTHRMGDIRIIVCPPYIVEDHEITIQSGVSSYWYHPETDQLVPRVRTEGTVYIQDVNVKRERLFLAHAKVQERTGKGKAGAGKSRQTEHRFPKDLFPMVGQIVREHTEITTSAACRCIPKEDRPKGMRLGTLSDHLGKAARGGELNEHGVAVMGLGYPTILRAKGGEGDE